MTDRARAILVYAMLAIFVLGFGLAAATAGAPAAVAVGTLGLLGTFVAVIARIDAETGPTGHGRGLR